MHLLDSAYVGNSTVGKDMSHLVVCQHICELKQEYQEHGKTLYCSPEVLCDNFRSLATHLPDQVSAWNVQLSSQYVSVLTNDFKKEIIKDKAYTMPDLSSLPTKSKQLRALEIVRNHAVKHWEDLLQSHDKINEHVLELMKQSGRRSGNSNFLANNSTPQVHPPPQRYNHNPHLQYGPSLAEKTISSYKTPNDNIPTRRHNQTGAEHPYNATTDYLSMYPLGWVGCYACGDQGHSR